MILAAVLRSSSRWVTALPGGPHLKTEIKRALRALYPITRLRFIVNRSEYPHILNAMGLFGEGVEVGVQRAAFAEQILSTWRGTRLYCVDPWKAYPESDYRDLSNVSQTDQDRNFAEARERLRRFGARAVILRMESRQAAALFQDRQLDFVYLDARHDYESVAADIRVWSPKIRPGGILSGHDYLNGLLAEGDFGVKRAVQEFAKAFRLCVRTSYEAAWPSWFIQL